MNHREHRFTQEKITAKTQKKTTKLILLIKTPPFPKNEEQQITQITRMFFYYLTIRLFNHLTEIRRIYYMPRICADKKSFIV